MTSPYDTALRILRLDVDARCAAVAAAAAHAGELDARHAAACERLRREAALAAADRTLAAPAYLGRVRGDRARLADERAESDRQLQTLRDLAGESYGSLRAIEAAADEHRAQVERAAAALEQTRIDDLVGARLARTRRDRHDGRCDGRRDGRGEAVRP